MSEFEAKPKQEQPQQKKVIPAAQTVALRDGRVNAGPTQLRDHRAAVRPNPSYLLQAVFAKPPPAPDGTDVPGSLQNARTAATALSVAPSMNSAIPRKRFWDGVGSFGNRLGNVVDIATVMRQSHAKAQHARVVEAMTYAALNHTEPLPLSAADFAIYCATGHTPIDYMFRGVARGVGGVVDYSAKNAAWLRRGMSATLPARVVCGLANTVANGVDSTFGGRAANTRPASGQGGWSS